MFKTVPPDCDSGEWNTGKTPEEICNDAFFSVSQIKDLNKISILDIGCGAGRLAKGLLQQKTDIKNYTGVDVRKQTIEHCEKEISVKDERYKFYHLKMKNLRYNNVKNFSKDVFENFLPYQKKYDLIYMFSVFSHLEPSDTQKYLKLFKNILEPNGVVFLTCFIEKNFSKNYEENPKHRKLTAGRLHCCLYNQDYFEKLIEKEGLNILECSDRFQEDNDGQKLYLLNLK